MRLIDIGVNLTRASFAPEREALLARAHVAGMAQMVITGTSLVDGEQALQLCGELDEGGRLFTAAGARPRKASHWNAGIVRSLRALFNDQRARAVGECGLDFDRDFSLRPAQGKALEEQSALAVGPQRPVFLYERDASERLLAALHGFCDRLPVAVVHCFTGERRVLYGCLDLDLYIDITGWTNGERRGIHLCDLVSETLVGHLMLESDAPYLLPCSLRPKPKSGRNESAYLVEVLARVVRHHGESMERLVVHTNAAARALLSLSTTD